MNYLYQIKEEKKNICFCPFCTERLFYTGDNIKDIKNNKTITLHCLSTACRATIQIRKKKNSAWLFNKSVFVKIPKVKGLPYF